jgi:multidrug efflux pump
MGGLLVATLLTLLFLPAVYAVWFKATRGKKAFLGDEVVPVEA